MPDREQPSPILSQIAQATAALDATAGSLNAAALILGEVAAGLRREERQRLACAGHEEQIADLKAQVAAHMRTEDDLRTAAALLSTQIAEVKQAIGRAVGMVGG